MKKAACYALVLGIFFFCGFCTTLNSVLIAYLRDALEIPYSQVIGVQVAFFVAYFLVSPVAGRYFHKHGELLGIRRGLALCALGAALFLACAWKLNFALILLASFVIGSGIAILQVTANPYASTMGSPESASSRLCLCQAFTSLGMLFAPWLGSLTLLREAELSGPASGNAIIAPYSWLTLAWILLLAASPTLNKDKTQHEEKQQQKLPPWQDQVLLVGMLGIGLAVGAETAVGSFLIPFLHQDQIVGLSLTQAGELTMIFWGLLMLGRFLGAFLLRWFRPESLIAAHATTGVALALLACCGSGMSAAAAALALGLSTSVMFPTFFSIVLERCRCGKSLAAGCLCMANVGGALIPLIQGAMSDKIGLQAAFILPAMCYAGLLGCSGAFALFQRGKLSHSESIKI